MQLSVERSTGYKDDDYRTLGMLYANWLAVRDHAPYAMLPLYRVQIQEFYADCQSNYEGTF